jgi:4-coumarate--CoA ligase
MEYVKQRRIRYKWIREVEFVDEIPKSPSSKILRRVLRESGKSGKKGHVVNDSAISRL